MVSTVPALRGVNLTLEQKRVKRPGASGQVWNVCQGYPQ
ncbi:mCG148159 [Mus musculus]|nr:mCG148159 [Mus musculus]